MHKTYRILASLADISCGLMAAAVVTKNHIAWHSPLVLTMCFIYMALSFLLSRSLWEMAEEHRPMRPDEFFTEISCDCSFECGPHCSIWRDKQVIDSVQHICRSCDLLNCDSCKFSQYR